MNDLGFDQAWNGWKKSVKLYVFTSKEYLINICFGRETHHHVDVKNNYFDVVHYFLYIGQMCQFSLVLHVNLWKQNVSIFQVLDLLLYTPGIDQFFFYNFVNTRNKNINETHRDAILSLVSN